MINRFHAPTNPLQRFWKNLKFLVPNPGKVCLNPQSQKDRLPLQGKKGVLQCADSIDNQTGAPTPLQIEQPKNSFQSN